MIDKSLSSIYPGDYRTDTTCRGSSNLHLHYINHDGDVQQFFRSRKTRARILRYNSESRTCSRSVSLTTVSHHSLSGTMRVYNFDNLPGDQRLPHEAEPVEPLAAADLKRLGILYYNVPVDDRYETSANTIAAEREYKNRDIIELSRATLGEAYDAKLKVFFDEYVLLFLSGQPCVTFVARKASARRRRNTIYHRWQRVFRCSR